MTRFAVLAAVLQSFATPQGSRAHATLCLDPQGTNLGATCRTLDASAIRKRPDICQCLNSGMMVAAPYCAEGERPQAETAAYDRARYAASKGDGTLVGKRYQGRSFCVPAP